MPSGRSHPSRLTRAGGAVNPVPGVAVDHRVDAAVRQWQRFAASGVYPDGGRPGDEDRSHPRVRLDGIDVQPVCGEREGKFAGASAHIGHPLGSLADRQICPQQ